MLDNQNRILIPKELLGDVSIRKGSTINIYFDENEKLFFIDELQNSEYFFIAKRKVDMKNRFFVPAQIYKTYETKKILCGIKNYKIYLLPMKKV